MIQKVNFSIVIIILVVFLGISFCSESNEELPMAKINQGKLRGQFLKSRDGRQYSAFRGIPYAKPPKRFQDAEPPTKWEGVRDAKEFGNKCAQKRMYNGATGGKEDCLFLNVYSPNMNGKLPTMVFIHGGAFMYGDGDAIGADFVMDENVVLVTINYRLGAFGFLSTGDGEIDGNFGMKDQIRALRWVKENIKSFGGDKEKVTVFGVSAGGAAVHYLILSPLSKGLFHGAIVQSGSAFNSWAFVENPGERAIELGTQVGCPTSNFKELAKCLKNVDAEKITNANFVKWYTDPFAPFAPTVEINSGSKISEIFLPEHPLRIATTGKANKIPVMFTFCKDEGISLHAAVVVRNEQLTKDMDEDWLRVAPITFYYDYDKYSQSQKNWISGKLRDFYFGTKTVGKETEGNLTNLYTDQLFAQGIANSALLHARYSPSFAGVFTQPLAVSIASSYFGLQDISGGPAHGDDMALLFPMEIFNVQPSEKGSIHEAMSKYTLKLWANFAATGNPGLDYNELKWYPVSPKEVEMNSLNWMSLTVSPKLLKTPFTKRHQFLDKVFEEASQYVAKEEL